MTTLERLERKITTADLAVHEFPHFQGKKVFTNGCFDLIHTGHITYLSESADLGDHLILGLNTDKSVQRLKGPSRPVKDEINRALVLAGFEFIDAVILFDDDTPLPLINALKPDILVKGGDYDPLETNPQSPSYIVGSAEVKQWGGTVETISFVEGYSSSRLIEKSKES